MSRLPETGPSLTRWLRQQERNAQRQASSSAFARSGTSVTAEGAQSLDGTLTVTPGSGFVRVDGSLGVHGTAAFDGSTTIGGDLTVAGTLSLPNGIIPDDALANVVVPAECVDFLQGFTLTTTPAVIWAKTLTVPTDITSVLVLATVTVFADNTTATLGGLSTSFQIGTGNPSWLESVDVEAGVRAKTVSTHTTVLTGLTPGSTFDIATTATTSANWGYGAGNIVRLSGHVLWFR